jgi:hypothetical protein
VRLAFGAATDVRPVDLLEDPAGDLLHVDDGAVALELRPFQLFTLRVR